MRISCVQLPTSLRRGRDTRPARASGMVPPLAPACCPAPTDPRGDPRVVGLLSFRVCCVLWCLSVRAGERTPAPSVPWSQDPKLARSCRRLTTSSSSRGRRTQRVPRGALSKCSDPKVCLTTRKSSPRPKGRRHDPKVVATTPRSS